MSAEHITVVAGSLTVTDHEDGDYVLVRTRGGVNAVLDGDELQAAVNALTEAKYRRERAARAAAEKTG